ncbi:N-acetyl sugar amidotransferase [Candidatus Pelagibacter sp.]|jgi:N-acetyl sugar amidotransferase|nr:N-acetyl sugar amidotransferase [Candidatus Pelagibacter sp.]
MTFNKKKSELFWCTNCLNNSLRPRISFDKKGWCNACQWMVEKKKIDWKKRRKELLQIVKKFKSNSIYDCIVPVSGGKDGSYVASKIRDELGLNPLTVTSRPPLELDVGKKNLTNFLKNSYDHVHVTTNYKAMQRLNKLGLIKKGSPYYGWLTSIFSTVLKVAVQHNINLIFYGEDGEIEYGGSTENKNKAIFDAKYMIKNYFEGGYHQILKQSKLSSKELYWFEFPIKEIEKKSIGLTHWGYFEPWDSYRNYLVAKSKFNLDEHKQNSSGTFTNFAQNDQSLFALHTYLMYLKFGFGRATQDAGIEIRRKAMTREQGLNLVKLYDNHFPEEFIEEYLEYFRMSKGQFMKVIDFWANKKLFKKVKNKWVPKFSIK